MKVYLIKNIEEMLYNKDIKESIKNNLSAMYNKDAALKIYNLIKEVVGE